MKVKLIREAKYFCHDFEPIRKVLVQMNAQFITVKRQSDFVFKLQDPFTGEGSKRIKVRIENDDSIFVYEYSRKEQEVDITFDYYEVSEKQIISKFTSLYGEPLNIRKVREIWSKDNAVFHLDIVEGVGKIFEIEYLNVTSNQEMPHWDEYIKLFEKYLLKQVHGSNEDLMSQ